MLFNKSKKKMRLLSGLLAFLVFFAQLSITFPVRVQGATEGQTAAETLKVYPAPSGATLNTTYTVKVREPGGEWKDLDEYQTTVGGYTPSSASFAYFDSDGPVEVSVTNNSGAISQAAVRPLSRNITPTISGNTMNFTVSEPMKLSVEINGNVQNNLSLFVNPIEVNAPSPTDPNVIYLGPGIYNQNYTVPSGKTLYIAGGAIVKGTVYMDNATNVKLMGRGIIDHPAWKAVSADYSNQVTIDGVIVNDYGEGNNGGCAIELGNSSNVTVNNFKGFSYRKWTDGIDTFGVTNVSINDIFMRTGDDCIALYSSRANGGRLWSGDSQNISITNSVLMPDVARPINMGTHGDPSQPGGGETIDTINISNIDILEHNTAVKANIAPIQVFVGDGNLITNVNFTDIRTEDACVGSFINMSVSKGPDHSTPGRGLNNFYFKNITYTGIASGSSQVVGYDATHLAQNVTFENLKMNGNLILNATDGKFNVNSYTKNLNFIAQGADRPSTSSIPFPKSINLAYNKTAVSDSSLSGFPAFKGNDGSNTSRWSAADQNAGHWWTVDLGSNMNITGTQVMWEKSDLYQYKIESSNDNINWTMEVDKTGNTNTDQIQNNAFINTARYVRITITGMPNDSNASFYDFQVFGKANNLALNKTAVADSTQSGYPASNASDSNPTSLWCANDNNDNHWLSIDLGSSKEITYGTQVSWEKSDLYKYKIETSNNNSDWKTVVDKTDNTSSSQIQTDYFSDTARYIRITVTGVPSSSSAAIYDFKVFGDFNNLAQGKVATSDSSQPSNPASKGNDGNINSKWSANNGDSGHWWMVDLGSIKNITNGTQVMWEKGNVVYQYKIETSNDLSSWSVRVDKSNTVTGNNGNCNASQVQADYFTASARYVRISVYGTTNDIRASFYDFQVLGDTSTTTEPVITGKGGFASHIAPGSKIKMVVNPNRDVTWSVTDVEGNPTTLANIDIISGLLTAGAVAGTIKVVATYSDGAVSRIINIDTSELKTVDDGDESIHYTQGSSDTNWSIIGHENAYGGFETTINPALNGPYESEVKAEFTFMGTGVQWIGKLAEGEAIVDVYIDGIKMATVDPYNETSINQHINYSIEGLDYGTHTIKLVNTGKKNIASSDNQYNLTVDAFRYLDPSIQSVTLYADKTSIGYGDKAILNPAAILTTGDVFDLTLGNVTYTSSKPIVASVNANGVVTALNSGTTNITATVEKHGLVMSSNTLTITVTPDTAIVAEADADVHSWKDEKQRNYGSKNVMLVQYNAKLDPTSTFNTWMYHPDNASYDGQTDTTDMKVSYLRFDLASVDKTKVIKKAELRVSSATDLSSKKLRVLGVDNVNWKEGTKTGLSPTADAVLNDGSLGINFFCRPQLGSTVVVGNGGKANESSALDITNYIKSITGNKVTVALESDSSNGTTAYSLNTRESTNAAYRPTLFITYYTADEMVSNLASAITGIPAPEKDATKLTLPSVPEGYSITMKSVAPEGIVSMDQTIVPPAAPVTVNVIFTITDNVTRFTADTLSIPITVPGRTLKTNADLNLIEVDGEPLSGFEAGTTDYTIRLPYGTTQIPVVSGSIADLSSSAVVTQASSVNGSAIITVTAEDGTTTKSYTVKFETEKNNDATLKGIMVNEVSVEGFAPETTSYTVRLPYGTIQIPEVTGTATDENAKVVVTQASSVTGSAIIEVTAEDGTTTKSYTVQFETEKNNDATLNGIIVNEVAVEGFAPETTSYTVILPYGTTQLPEVTGTATDENAKVVVTQASSVTGSAMIEVTAEDGITTKSYTVQFEVGKNNDATLNGITIDGKELSGFAGSTTSYTVRLPYGTTQIPVVTGTATDENTKIVVTQASTVTGSAVIEVTAEDGTTTKSYTVKFEVEKNNDATLKGITIDGKALSGFVGSTTSYTVRLPYGTTQVPVVTGIVTDENAKIVVTQASTVTGSAVIEVTSEDGTTTKSYTVKFEVEKNNDATLKGITIDGKNLSGFAGSTTSYIVKLPYGTTRIPVVTGIATDNNAKIKVTQASSVNGTAVIEVTAEDGTTTKSYTVKFEVEKNNDATLKGITIDGKALSGFAGSTTSYIVKLPYGSAQIPVVAGTATDNNAKIKVTQASTVTGTAIIEVTAEDGTTTKSYTVKFEVEKNSDATLKGITIDGKALSGFAGSTTSYIIRLPYGTKQIPVVIGTATDKNAKVVVSQASSVTGSAVIAVTAEKGTTKKSYNVKFTVAKNSDATLKGITVGGKALSGFTGSKTSYTIILPYGTKKASVIAATATDKNAKVVVSQASSVTGSAVITVTAENGTTKKTYTVKFTVAKNSDATLKGITVGGKVLSGFAGSKTSYTITLPYGTKKASVIAATATDKNAKVVVSQASSVTGSAVITVTAENGTTKKSYTVKFTVAKNSDATLKGITVGGKALSGFTGSKTSYTITLPYGTKKASVIAATATDKNAKVVVSQASSVTGSAVITVTAENGTTKKTYTIKFVVAKKK